MTKWTIPEPADALETIRQLRARVAELEDERDQWRSVYYGTQKTIGFAIERHAEAEARAEAAEALLARAYEAGRDDAAALASRVANGYDAGGDKAIACGLYLTIGNIRALTPPADLAARLEGWHNTREKLRAALDALNAKP